jgi:hypothetical protein
MMLGVKAEGSATRNYANMNFQFAAVPQILYSIQRGSSGGGEGRIDNLHLQK